MLNALLTQWSTPPNESRVDGYSPSGHILWARREKKWPTQVRVSA